MLWEVDDGIEGFGGVFDLLDDKSVMDYFLFSLFKACITWGKGDWAMDLMFDSFVHDFPFDSFLWSSLLAYYLGLNRPQYSITFYVM